MSDVGHRVQVEWMGETVETLSDRVGCGGRPSSKVNKTNSRRLVSSWAASVLEGLRVAPPRCQSPPGLLQCGTRAACVADAKAGVRPLNCGVSGIRAPVRGLDLA